MREKQYDFIAFDTTFKALEASRKRTLPYTVDLNITNNEPCNCGSEIKYKKCCKFKK